MYVFDQFVNGILIIHLALALAFVLGASIRARGFNPSREVEPSLDLVVSIGTGMAAVGVATFVFGIAHLLTVLGFVLMLAILFGAIFAVTPQARARAFWQQQGRIIAGASNSVGLVAVWILAILLAFPAALPPTAFDATFYHQVYALEWANDHALTVDVYRRFPWYADNWLLDYLWFEVFRIGDVVQFATWSTGALSAVLLFGLTRERVRNAGVVWRELAATFSALPLLATPAFLRWLDTGMNDVALGFFFTLAVVVSVRYVIQRGGESAIAPIILCGFLIGLKPTFLAFAPLFILLLAIGLRERERRWRVVGIASVALLLVAAPWYVKNTLQDGDPVAPIINIALHRPDRTISPNDYAGISIDMQSDRGPGALAGIPLRMFLAPDTLEFREPGFTLATLLLALPFFVFAYGALRRQRTELVCWSAAYVLAYAYWIETAHFGRYALLFYPLLVAICIRVAIGLGERLQLTAGRVAVVTAAAALVLSLPTPASAGWYAGWYAVNYGEIAQIDPDRETYLRAFLAGYTEEESVAAWMATHPQAPRRIYAVRLEQLAYYAEEHDISFIGDWVGPARYSDFTAAARAGNAAGYLDALGVGALIVPQHSEVFDEAAVGALERQLLAHGYQRLPTNGKIDILVRRT